MVQLPEEKLRELRMKEAEELAQVLSKRYGIPYLDLSKSSIEVDALKLVPEEKARRAKLAVFQRSGKTLQVAVMSPNPDYTQRVIKELEKNGYKVNLYLVSETSLERAWQRYHEVKKHVEIPHGIVEVSEEKMRQFMRDAGNLDGIKKLFDEIIGGSKKQRNISDLLEIILAGAVSSEASDIHIEPQEKNVRLRLRLDGVLHDVVFFDKKVFPLLLSRIKLVSGLKLNIHNKAQDGRFSIHLQDIEVEVRVSVIPENYGETIVMRILNPKSISVPLEELGMQKNLYDVVVKEIQKPNGMLLTTGPTGSGKTTTLYAFLRKIYSPDIKIITLEDPIEYHLEGIIQTQVDKGKGYTFANGLRAILRQDPDVIMVGEIRDLETAKIAVNAALTGHFVFSTLHTNNAAGTIPRLIDIGVNPAIIPAALNVSMAQRLVRKLCNNCKEQYEPSEEERQIVERVVEGFPKNYPKPDISKLSLWRARGCEKCSGIGYKGRIGVFEAILIDEKIERLVINRPSENDIFEAAKGQGILRMAQDGILKVLEGITSLKELQRVVEL